jgi:hypothetical protein
MSGTNVPQPTFGNSGFIAPSEAAILSGVTLDINAAFGNTLNFVNLETPQGQLASSEAAIIADSYDQFVFYTQQVDPQYASGRMQDGIARIYFITRLPATATAVQLNCLGAPGVVIPVGAQVPDQSNNIYACTELGTIASNGTISLPFQCTSDGPTICAAGAIGPVPYQTIPGWDSATNPAAGVTGTNVESRGAFELRRQQSVAINSVGAVPAIAAAVASVPNVVDCYVVDNPSSAPVPINGYTLAPHSIYVAASGGEAQAIGQAIWSKKAPGCAYNGNATVTVADQSNGYAPPYTTYQVSFEIPVAATIYFAITIANSPAVPSNATSLIQSAVISAFNGTDGGTRARIGSKVYASRFICGIAALGPWAQIVSIFIGETSSPTQSVLQININQIPVTSSDDIVVTFA